MKKIIAMLSLTAIFFAESAMIHAEKIDSNEKREIVVLLHGLGRSAGSMSEIASALEKKGCHTLNIDYPSTDYPVEKLVEMVKKKIAPFIAPESPKLHFVTHSMGGILVRTLLKDTEIPNLGRVVMLSPPNHGSEVVDHLKEWEPFVWMNGPAALQLGTGPDSLPNRLGPVDFDLGIITGTDLFFPDLIFSEWFEGEHDGKVSVESAKVAGMNDFLVVPASHTFIMRDDEVIRQVLYYLKYGAFDRSSEESED